MGNQSSASGRDSRNSGGDLQQALRESQRTSRNTVSAAPAHSVPAAATSGYPPPQPRAAYQPATSSRQQAHLGAGTVSNVTEARISQAFKQFSPSGKPVNRAKFDEALGIAESLGLRRLQGTVLGTSIFFFQSF